MRPIYPRSSKDFERVKDLEWIEGTIAEIKERVNDNRRYKDKDTGEYLTRSVDELRLAFKLNGYEYKHYSRWMTKSVAETSNFYGKYLKELIPGLAPDTAIDLDKLVGIKIKTMWDTEKGKDGNDYQTLKMIKPLDVIKPEDISFDASTAPPPPPPAEEADPSLDGSDLPF